MVITAIAVVAQLYLLHRLGVDVKRLEAVGVVVATVVAGVVL